MTAPIQIDIVSDAICPWCFIGKRRLEKALAERPDIEVAINWRPFQLNPDMPREGMERADYVAAKFGSVERARQMYANVAAAGAEEGVSIAYDRMQRTPNTLDAHRLIRWADSAGVQGKVVELLFTRFFEQGADIGDHDTLVTVAEEAGMDGAVVRDLLASDADLEAVQAEDAYARKLGIQGVPCFIIDRRYAVSGAQEPEAFIEIFKRVQAEAATAAE